MRRQKGRQAVSGDRAAAEVGLSARRFETRTPCVNPSVTESPATRDAGIAGRPNEILPPNSAFELRKQEEVQHPKRVWTDDENADIPLSRLMAEYRTYLNGRARPAARGTIEKYQAR